MKMKKIFLLILALMLLISVSCDTKLAMEPYNCLPGSYVHKAENNQKFTDLAITLGKDGSASVIEYSNGQETTNLKTTYSYEYTTFNYENVTGNLTINGYKTFNFTWYSNREYFLKLELVDVTAKKTYTMKYGSIS